MALTPAQLLAISTRDRTLLVSAAAGSGKTFTLTQRIIKSITEDGGDISRMLVVTFTKSAAAELRSKISKALSEALTADPTNTHLQNQILKLGSANISTIDSFFTEPVRKNFEKLNIPPGMRLADDAELDPIRTEVMRDCLELAFEVCDKLGEGQLMTTGYKDITTDIAGMISAARDSSTIIPTLLGIYQKLMTSTEGIALLKKHGDRLRAYVDVDLFDTEEGKILRHELTMTARNVTYSLEKLAEKIKDDPSLEPYYTCFLADANLCRVYVSALENPDLGFHEVAEIFKTFQKPRIASLPKGSRSQKSEKHKKMRSDKLLEKMKQMKDNYFSKTRGEINYILQSTAAICEFLSVMLEDFDHNYSEEKRKKGLCEFSDMPRFMLKLLLNEDGSYTDYADQLYNSFDAVYIDEYQDVNDVQDRIFEIIGRDHRYMVGDIKQSIYGFREAEPSIFASYRRRFAEYRDGDPLPESGGNTIYMSENFRCDKAVISFANRICSMIFSAFSESIGYTSEDDLRFSKDKDDECYRCEKVIFNIVETPKAELPLIDDEESAENAPEASANESEEDEDDVSIDNLYDEAIITANEIARLIRDERGRNGEPLHGGDIAVLVRSHRHAKPLISALRKLNIKYTESSRKGLSEDRDMQILIDLLSTIDNPRSDIPLSRLITADTDAVHPILSFEEIVRIRSLNKKQKDRSLYDSILNYIEQGEDKALAERCSTLEKLINKLRSVSSKLSAEKFLRVIASHERFAELCRTDAFVYLYDCACRYVKGGWNGLYSFVKYLKSLMEKGESGKEPDSGDLDAVTVMTVHQSKGLEFNTCFVFGTAKQFNTSDTKNAFIFSKELGLSVKLPPAPDPDADIVERTSVRYADTITHFAGSTALKSRLLEEEARILYVALTRARERLYVSGTLSNTFTEAMEDALDCPDEEYGIRHSKNYLSWMLLAICGGGTSDFCKVNVYKKGKNRLTDKFTFQNGISVGKNATEDEKEYAELLSSPHGQTEEEKLLSLIPAKVAASKVSKTMLDDSIFIPVPTGLLFSDSDEDKDTQSADTDPRIQNRISLMRSRKIELDSLLEINKKPTAAEKGSAAHLFLQFCDYNNAKSMGIDTEIDRLLSLRFISERTAKIIDRKALSGFFKSRLFDEIEQAESIRREFHFGLFKSASEFTENDSLKSLTADKKIYVQGSIDLVIEKKDGSIILCDYKTDRISSEELADRALLLENMRKKHSGQLSEYRYAVEQIFGKIPDKVFIYSIPLGEALEI